MDARTALPEAPRRHSASAMLAGLESSLMQWPRRVIVARDSAGPNREAFQVQFPRVEIVLSGVYRNQICDADGNVLTLDLLPGDCLFLPPNSWNLPAWDEDVSVMSLLFGKLHLGFSRISWSVATQSFAQVDKRSCFLPGSAPAYSMVSALSGLPADQLEDGRYANLLVRALIEHSLELVIGDVGDELSRPRQLYQGVCSYIQENYSAQLTRDRLAAQFEVSPNYLSRVFREQGNIGVSEYINTVRIERAKFMLKRYALQLKEISQRCGFQNVNYFCRAFKTRVGRTPTEFRTGS